MLSRCGTHKQGRGLRYIALEKNPDHAPGARRDRYGNGGTSKRSRVEFVQNGTDKIPRET